MWTELVCDTVPFPQRWPRWRFRCLRGHDSPSPNQGMSRILVALKYLEDVNKDDGHGAAQPRAVCKKKKRANVRKTVLDTVYQDNAADLSKAGCADASMMQLLKLALEEGPHWLGGLGGVFLGTSLDCPAPLGIWFTSGSVTSACLPSTPLSTPPVPFP